MSNWVTQEVSGCTLSDKRLNNRLETIINTLSKNPQKSIPGNCKTWSSTQATYRFLSNPSVSAGDILKGHTQSTLDRIKGEAVVIVAQDTTFINLETEDDKKKMGTLTRKKKNEYLLHPSIVFTPERTNLGVLHHTLWKRPEEKVSDRGAKRIEEKESYRWLLSYQMSCALQQQHPDTLVVNVGDRESDIYELFIESEQVEFASKAEFIIRAKSNRLVDNDEDNHRYLWDEMTELKSMGTYKTQLERTKYREAREGTFDVRFKEVTFTRGKRKGGNHPPVSVYAVYATEKNPPKGETPIRWMLLTSLPIETLAQAQTVIGWYKVRWEIELFFRVLKSGCKVKELRLETDERIEKALAVYMIIAWRLHNITMIAREKPESPCDEVYAEEEWQLIYLLQKRSKPKTIPGTREITRLLAMRGGFLARKGDGEPGIATIWKGYIEILNYLKISEELKAMNDSGICV